MKKIIALGNFPQHVSIPGVKIHHYPQTYLSSLGTIDRQLAWLSDQQADGYVGTNDIAALKAVIASGDKRQISAMLATQNKYSARQVINGATSANGFVELAGASQRTSGFIKPIRSSLSFAAAKFTRNKEVHYHVSKFKNAVIDRNSTFKQLASAAGADSQYLSQLDDFIVEELIDYPEQCTVDGFVQNGKVTIIGATRSVLHENNFSFLRFDFPMRTENNVLQKLHHQTEQAIIALGLDNTTFNCELKFDSIRNLAAIIEVNARMSMQFRPLFIAVTGWDIAAVAVQIAAGITATKTQRATANEASIHILRHHSDDYILYSPTIETINKIEEKYRHSKVHSFVKINTYLSDTPQDGMTYRYAQVFMPEKGSSIQSARRLRRIQKELGFVFEPTTRISGRIHNPLPIYRQADMIKS